MHPSTFDHLTRRLSTLSRRDLTKALLFAATAIRLTPVRIVQAQDNGAVPPGGACAERFECQQDPMRGEAICADNGFTSDGDLNCCANDGCCASDADCCGDLRCAPTGDVCSICRQPPFPTRLLGQACDSDDDCLASVTCTVGCVSQRCTCLDGSSAATPPAEPPLPLIPDAESAMAFAEWLSLLENGERYDILYRTLHPDAQSLIPPRVITRWYRRESATRGAEQAEAVKVRFIPWTWQVTGTTYPETAEIAFRQELADGTLLRDEVRLVKDQWGNWRWFFGRDRAFVEEQIARHGRRRERDQGSVEPAPEPAIAPPE